MLKDRGFTLVELLITMSIMGLLMSVVSYNYSQYSSLWNKKFGDFDERHKQMKLRLQIRDVLLSIEPYIVSNKSGEKSYYFLGRKDGMTFVTSAPIFSFNGGSSVARLFQEETIGNRYRLVYEEAPLENVTLNYIEQKLNFQYRLIIEPDIDKVDFRYFGWESANLKYNGLDANPLWRSEFDGDKTKLQPEIIQITISDFEYNIYVAFGDKKLLNRFLDPEV